jgi:hypothetical protein
MGVAAGGAEPERDWRAEFREAVLRYIVREGSPIDERASCYSDYHHPDWLGIGAHLNMPEYIRQGRYLTGHQRAVIADWSEGTGEGCELDFERMSWSGGEWTRWGGTMGEDERVECVDATVWCRCGRIAGIVWRWNGGMAELMRGITGW